MAFADPQSVTINAVANSLARVPTSRDGQGTFQKDDNLVRLSISHSYDRSGGANRMVKLEHFKIAADPLMAGVNAKKGVSVHMVVKTPDTGYTIAEQKQIVDALTGYLTATSGARVTQLLGGEG
jgi:hypothetical protein